MSRSAPYPFSSTRDPRDFIHPDDMSPGETEAFQLFLLAEAGVRQIRLLAGSGPDTAPECHETDGFEMTVDEAMWLKPLPHEAAPGTRCTCTYRPAEQG